MFCLNARSTYDGGGECNWAAVVQAGSLVFEGTGTKVDYLNMWGLQTGVVTC